MSGEGRSPASPGAVPPRLALAALLLLTALGLAWRVATVPGYWEEIDARHFTRALTAYDLLAQRPHWPGYPVYVWAGRLVLLLTGDPTRALHLLSALCTSLLTLPLYGACRRAAAAAGLKRAPLAGLVAALLWQGAPISHVDGTEILSDPLALLLATALLAACMRAGEREVGAWGWLALGALGGMLLGVRLSYVPLLWPLAWLALGSSGQRRRALAWITLGGAAACGLWLGWQLAEQGAALWAAARLHLTGHFTSWGAGIVTEGHPLERAGAGAITLLSYGLGGPGIHGAGAARWGAALGWGIFILAGSWALARRGGGARGLLGGWILGYAAWILLAHDVGLARYHLPLVAGLAMVGGVGAAALVEGRGGRAAVIPILLAALPLAVSGPLARIHQAQPDLAEQLGRWAGASLWRRGATLRVEPRLTSYVEGFVRAGRRPGPGGMGSGVEVAPADVELRAAARGDIRRGLTAYTTSWELDRLGLSEEGWAPVATFCRDPWLHSWGAHRWILYTWVGAGGGAGDGLRPCEPMPQGFGPPE